MEPTRTLASVVVLRPDHPSADVANIANRRGTTIGRALGGSIAALGALLAAGGAWLIILRGPEKAEFMANSQSPWGVDALNGAVTQPAWQSKPSWYLVATDDRMIPPPAQRAMSKRAGSNVIEVRGSHAVYVSQPEAVAELIKKAAQTLATK